MTDPGVAPAPFVPKAWPVRRFVLALVLLGVVFGALWWSGLAAPRLNASSPEITVDRETGRASMKLVLHNQRPVPRTGARRHRRRRPGPHRPRAARWLRRHCRGR